MRDRKKKKREGGGRVATSGERLHPERDEEDEMDKMEQGPAQQIRRGCQKKVTWEVRDGGEADGVALANQKNGHEAEGQYFGLMEGGGGARNR